MYEEYDSVRLLLRFPPTFLGAFAAFFDGVFAIIDTYGLNQNRLTVLVL